jgi:hypothetical protein
MLQKPLATSEDFLKVKQNFDQIPAVHVSYASSYLALLQCNLVEHPIVDIWEDLGTLRFFQHGEYLPQINIKSLGLHTTIVQTLLMEGQSPRPMLTTRRQNGSSTT